MAKTFAGTESYGRMRRYATQVLGGLAARKELKGESEAWYAMRDRIESERSARERADDLVVFASSQLRVDDVDWDASIGDVSGTSFLASGKRADAEPYSVLFGKVTASNAQGLGRVKAAEVGERVVRDGRRLQVPELEATLAKLDTATEALKSSSQAYDDAEDGLFDPRRAKAKCARDLNDLVDTTEARILTAFPGRRDLVTAILRPWYERKRARRAGEDEVVDTSAMPPDDFEDDDAPEE